MFEKLRNLSIAIKIPTGSVLNVFTTAMVFTILAYYSAKTEINFQAESKLEAVREGRTSELSSYLNSIQEDLLTVSSNPNTATTINDFQSAWIDFEGDAETAVRDLYLTSQLSELYNAGDDSSYTQAHIKHHPWFHQLQITREYYDVFLFNTEGDLIYSVFKEADFGTNMYAGEWKDTDLANVFKAALSLNKEQVSFFDFRPYAPSGNAPASFIATPVFDANDVKIGVLSFQMPIDRINNIMQNATGMGESGETYIVGSDFMMRSDSRFLNEGETSILNTKVEGITSQGALTGNRGTEIVEDYRGINVLSSYQPIEFNGVKWAILAEIDEEEVNRPVVDMRNLLTMIAAILVAVLGGISFIAARTITKPIAKTVEVMNVLSSEGRTDIDVPFQKNRDELGDIGRAIETFRIGMVERERLRQEAAEAEERKREQELKEQAAEARAAEEKAEQERLEAQKIERKAAELSSLIEKFDSNVSIMIQTVSSGATQLEQTAMSMTATADEAGTKSATVASAAELASANVQTVASASEELSVTGNEISSQMEKSHRATQDVAEKAAQATRIMEELTESSASINAIVQLINDIAEQTNLLALNATIESARAGDAGKGFAVVATEVKNLAGQTGGATDQISEQINNLQDKVKDAVSAIGDITSSIEETASMANSVAAAVEEQQTVTNEISRNVHEAARGTQDVSENINLVASGAAETASASAEVMGTSKDIAEQTVNLKQTIDVFLSDVSKIG